jgi:hypothetical protein
LNGWWEQSSPARFLESVLQTLRDGNVAHVELPRRCPEGMIAALSHLSSRYRGVVPRRIVPEMSEEDWRRSISDIRDQGDRLDAFAKAHSDALFVLELVEDVDVSRWRRFLERFHRATIQLESGRPQMLLLSIGDPAGPWLQRGASDIVTLAYRGLVNHLDMWNYTRRVMLDQQRHREGLHFNALTAAIASIAGYDPEVVELFADATSLKTDDAKLRVLEMQSQRGWIPVDDSEQSWVMGHVDTVEGAHVRHIAAYTEAELDSEIERRIWDGQVRTVFPIVERRRLELIQRHFKYLSNCLKEDGNNQTPYELEVGGVARYLATPIDRQDVTLAANLKEVRDRLAHLKVVPWKRLSEISSRPNSESHRG